MYRHPSKYTFGFIAHEVDFSWVKIVTAAFPEEKLSHFVEQI